MGLVRSKTRSLGQILEKHCSLMLNHTLRGATQGPSCPSYFEIISTLVHPAWSSVAPLFSSFCTDFKWSKNLTEKQKSVFHITKLRPMQLQTMNVTMSGKDCILIMPTGGGKSLCFQLPALLYDGMGVNLFPHNDTF